MLKTKPASALELRLRSGVHLIWLQCYSSGLAWVPAEEVNSPHKKDTSPLRLLQTNASLRIGGVCVTQDLHQLCHADIPERGFGGGRNPAVVIHISATHSLHQT